MNSDQFKLAAIGLVLMGCVGGWLTLRARRKAKRAERRSKFWAEFDRVLKQRDEDARKM